FPIKALAGERFAPFGAQQASSLAGAGERLGERPLSELSVVKHDRLGESEQRGGVVRRRAGCALCLCESFAQSFRAAPLLAAGRAADRERSEMELQLFVPILLLARAERERLAALNADLRSVFVKVVWDMTDATEVLACDVAAHRAGRQRRRVVRIEI